MTSCLVCAERSRLTVRLQVLQSSYHVDTCMPELLF